MAFHQFIEEILPVDLTLCSCTFYNCLFRLFFYRYRRARRARTILVLEIGNAENSLQFSLKDLTYAANYYRFSVNKAFVSVRLQVCLCSGRLMWGVGAISVTNSATEVIIALPTTLTVSYVTTWRLRRLLAGHYYVVLHVLNGLNDSL